MPTLSGTRNWRNRLCQNIAAQVIGRNKTKPAARGSSEFRRVHALLQRRPLRKQKSRRPLALLTFLENPPLQCGSLDVVVNFSCRDYFEHRIRSELRQSASHNRLCMRHKQVRRVKGAAGLHIDTVPSTVAVRHRYRRPALAHADTIRYRRTKGEYGLLCLGRLPQRQHLRARPCAFVHLFQIASNHFFQLRPPFLQGDISRIAFELPVVLPFQNVARVRSRETLPPRLQSGILIEV